MKNIHTVDINAPASVIFPWISEGHRVCQWVSNMESDETIEEKEGHVGSRFRQTYKERGKEMVMEGEVLEWEQDRRVKIAMHCPQFEMTLDMTIDPLGDGLHRVTQDADVQLKGVMFKTVGFLFGRSMRKQMDAQAEKDLQTLKAICEQEARSGGGAAGG